MQYGYHHENPLPNSGDFDEDSQEDYYDEEDPNEGGLAAELHLS
jgi:hypothetical protein